MTSLSFFEILLISLSLGFDAFSVALAAGAHGFTPRRIFRLGWHFGLFQFLMSIGGWGLGELLINWINHYAELIMFVLLFIIGARMIREGSRDAPFMIPDLSRGFSLITLSVATSVDALGVGLGFGLIGQAIIKPAIIIGVVCVLMTVIGLYLGTKLYGKMGHRTMIAGGIILIAIGVKLVI